MQGPSRIHRDPSPCLLGNETVASTPNLYRRTMPFKRHLEFQALVKEVVEIFGVQLSAQQRVPMH